MLKRLRNLKAPEVRFLLSVCLCVVFFVASGDEDPICSDEELNPISESGILVFVNRTTVAFDLTCKGPDYFFDYLWEWDTVATGYLKTGLYTWTAVAKHPPPGGYSNEGRQSYNGKVQVKAGVESTIYIGK